MGYTLKCNCWRPTNDFFSTLVQVMGQGPWKAVPVIHWQNWHCQVQQGRCNYILTNIYFQIVLQLVWESGKVFFHFYRNADFFFFFLDALKKNFLFSFVWKKSYNSNLCIKEQSWEWQILNVIKIFTVAKYSLTPSVSAKKQKIQTKPNKKTQHKLQPTETSHFTAKLRTQI